MNSNDFEKVIEEQIKKCKDILIDKSKEYARDDDRLHNFKNAAGIMGCDPKEALAGMMAKHTISVYDMCRDGEDHSIGLWNEKITDHINYLLLLKAIIIEEKQNAGKLHYFENPEVKFVRFGDEIEFNTTKDFAKMIEDRLHICSSASGPSFDECKSCCFYSANPDGTPCRSKLEEAAAVIIKNYVNEKDNKNE